MEEVVGSNPTRSTKSPPQPFKDLPPRLLNLLGQSPYLGEIELDDLVTFGFACALP
jgi:hypothetical protein